jgi:hypothetical protein
MTGAFAVSVFEISQALLAPFAGVTEPFTGLLK